MKALKLLLYRFFTALFGKSLLNLCSFGVKVGIKDEKKPKKYQFLIIITTDTESGYVGGNERRVWQMENPENFDRQTPFMIV